MLHVSDTLGIDAGPPQVLHHFWGRHKELKGRRQVQATPVVEGRASEDTHT